MLRHPRFLLGCLLLLVPREAGAETLVPSTIPAPVIFAGPCVWENIPVDPVRGQNQSLIETLIGSVITRGLDGIGTALEAAAAERTFVAVGSTNVDTPALAGTQCLQFWSGPLWMPGAPGRPDAAAIVRTTGLDRAEAQRLIEAGIRPTGAPSFFVELWVRRSAGGQYVAVTPTLMIRNASLETRRDPQTDRRVAIAASFLTVEVDKATTATVGPRLFGEGLLRLVSVDSLRNRDSCLAPAAPEAAPTPGQAQRATTGQAGPIPTAPAPGTSPTSASPAPQPAAQRRDCSLRGVPEAGWIPNPLDDGKPITLTMSVQETRRPNPVLSFVSGVFGDSKAEIKRETSEALIPSVGQAADSAEATRRAAAATKAATSFAAAEAARAAYCAADQTAAQRATSAANLYGLQLVANADALAADQSRRYPNPVSPTGDVQDPDICGVA